MKKRRDQGIYLERDGGLSIEVLGARYLFKLRAADTSGTLCQFEGVVPPGKGSPRHKVHREDKAFFIVDGTFEFVVGPETIRAATGDFVYVPRGVTHAFTNIGSADGRLLVSFTPAGHHEEMFSELATLPPERLPQAFAAFYERFGVEVL